MGSSDGYLVGVQTLLEHGSTADRFNVLILAEGYQLGELGTFMAQCDSFLEALLHNEPFDRIDVESALNVVRVDVASSESGVDDPVGCKGGTGAAPATFFDATVCANGKPRSMEVNAALVMSTAAAVLPAWGLAIVLVNSTKDAGSAYAGGEMIAVLTVADGWEGTALHEMGHLLGLADEYEYRLGCDSGETDHDKYVGPEPAEPNVTGDLAALKWASLVTPGTPVPTTENKNCAKCDEQPNPVPIASVGAFEGARYFHCGLYRPEFVCMMKEEKYRFCAVCRSHIAGSLAAHQAFKTIPEPGAIDVAPWPAELKWTTGAFESAWEIEVSQTADFSVEVRTLTTTETEIVQSVRFAKCAVMLEADTTYHWRVRKAVGLPPWAGWTEPRSFVTSAQAVVPLQPISGGRRGKVHPWDLTFSWTSAEGAERYEVQIADDAAFASLVRDPLVHSETQLVTDIRVKAKQNWRVRALAEGPTPESVLAGVWSSATPVVTSMPKVTLEAPANGEPVYPWPLDLSWQAVKGAERYIVEVTGEKGHFAQAVLEHGLEIPAPTTWTSDINMEPTPYPIGPSGPAKPHFWRVRVLGPPPLAEEGDPSDPRHFFVDGESTVVVKTAPKPPWNVNEPLPWLVQWETLKWESVLNAAGYRVRLWEMYDATPDVGPKVFEKTVPHKDGSHQKEGVTKAELDPQPGTVGYLWNVVAVGPEGHLGLGAENLWPLWIHPGTPEPIAPEPDAAGVPYDNAVFSFQNVFSPSGTYRVRLRMGGCSAPMGPAMHAEVPADAGETTSFTVPGLVPGTTYHWSVRARSKKINESQNTSIIDWAYPWSACQQFTTAQAPPQEPAVPEVMAKASLGPASVGVMLCFFKPTAGADHYMVEAQEVDPLDPTLTIGPVQGFDFDLDAIDAYVAELEADLGGDLPGLGAPGPWRVIGLGGTVALHAYRWRIRACNGNICSAFSEWASWAEYHQWPF